MFMTSGICGIIVMGDCFLSGITVMGDFLLVDRVRHELIA